MARFKIKSSALLVAAFAFSVWGQSSTDQQNNAPDQKQEEKHEPGVARETGAGAAAIGTGAAKGVGDAAKGTGKGAVDLVTLHPIDAGTSVGKGAVKGTKDLTVGAAKGTGKVARGVGRAFKKLF